ncbi:hypothetical protein FA13DRAFT_820595 [Coprinellus micaceus]|uniref:Secreted protein n=1 Tax=Coprinellus micaceus TaxID=71717 RepID=A0A4Y7S3L1_COPMI|nr:hypothetical protein FA13DRAFT_820595 [Coprinellus micaceus]
MVPCDISIHLQLASLFAQCFSSAFALPSPCVFIVPPMSSRNCRFADPNFKEFTTRPPSNSMPSCLHKSTPFSVCLLCSRPCFLLPICALNNLINSTIVQT